MRNACTRVVVAVVAIASTATAAATVRANRPNGYKQSSPEVDAKEAARSLFEHMDHSMSMSYIYTTKQAKSSKSPDSNGTKSPKSSGTKGIKTTKAVGKGKGQGKGIDAPTVGPPGPTSPTAPVVGAPTPAPNVPATLPPGTTASPTTEPPSIALRPYELLYTIEQFRLPLAREFVAVAALTDKYLDEFFRANYESTSLVIFDRAETEYVDEDFNFGEPVGISYETTVFFDRSSFLPSETDVNRILVRAFSNSNLDVYIQQLNALPISNLFSTTSEVSFDQSAAISSTRSSDGSGGGIFSSSTARYIGIGAAAGAGAALLLVIGLVMTNQRPKEPEEQVEQKEVDGHNTVGGDDTIEDSMNDSVTPRTPKSESCESSLSPPGWDEDDGLVNMRKSKKTSLNSSEVLHDVSLS